MASKQRNKNKVYDDKWRARRERQGQEYFLGVFGSREDAERAEREFDSWWPARQDGRP